MRATSLLAVVFSLSPLVAGCRGKVVGVATLHGAGSADVHISPGAKPFALWADTDGKWVGPGGRNSRFPARYEIDVLSKGAKIGHMSCDTHDSNETICGTETSIGDTHHADCELRLNCTLPKLPAGDVVLHVTGTPGRGATDIANMSLNIRES